MRWLKAPTVRGISEEGGVDRNVGAGVIRGYSVIEKGPARGHDMEIDDKTLDQVVALGNRAKAGIKSRFGHPDASSDALGTFLGRARDFRRVGDRVLADLHLDQSSRATPRHGDLGGYVMGLAESDPKAFGSSIAFSGTREPRLERDGTRAKGPDGESLPPLCRVKELRASDFVDSPAATSGCFSGTNVLLSAEATELLEELLPRADFAERLRDYLSRFLSTRDDNEPGLAVLREVLTTLEVTMKEQTEAPEAPEEPEEQAASAESVLARIGRILGVKAAAADPTALTNQDRKELDRQKSDAIDAERNALREDRVEFQVERDLAAFRSTVEPARLQRLEPILKKLKLAELGGDKAAATEYAGVLADVLPALRSDKAAAGAMAKSDDGAATAQPGPYSADRARVEAKLGAERMEQLVAKYPGARADATVH